MLGDTPPIDYIVKRENFDCLLAKLAEFAVDSYGAGFPKEGNTQLRVRIYAKIFRQKGHPSSQRLMVWVFDGGNGGINKRLNTLASSPGYRTIQILSLSV